MRGSAFEIASGLRRATVVAVRRSHQPEPADMTNGSPCPGCGESISIVHQGLSVYRRCPNCGWAIATTNTRHPGYNPAGYTVFVISSPHERDMDASRLAVALRLGGPAALEVLERHQPIAEAISAIDLRDLHAALASQWKQSRHSLGISTAAFESEKCT
jgi:hypothetical protein